MELKNPALEKLRERTKGLSSVSLEMDMVSKYPWATIAIIRGFDNFSYEAYTKGAFFRKEDAETEMKTIPPNGTLADTYHIVTTTVLDLCSGEAKDRKGRNFDDVDRSMIFRSLYDNLQQC